MATLTTEVDLSDLFRNSYHSIEVDVDIDAGRAVEAFDADELLSEMTEYEIIQYVLENLTPENVCQAILGSDRSRAYITMLSRDPADLAREAREKVVNELLAALKAMLLPPIPAEEPVSE